MTGPGGAAPGRFLLVELEPDLAHFKTTYNGVFTSVRLVSGVRSVVDLSAISRVTLDVFLRADDPGPPARRVKQRQGACAEQLPGAGESSQESEVCLPDALEETTSRTDLGRGRTPPQPRATAQCARCDKPVPAGRRRYCGEGCADAEAHRKRLERFAQGKPQS